MVDVVTWVTWLSEFVHVENKIIIYIPGIDDKQTGTVTFSGQEKLLEKKTVIRLRICKS